MKMERIRNYIYYLIGYKDYTEQEVWDKVYDRFEEEDIDLSELEEIFKYLNENKYLNDSEYVKNYTKFKYEKGYGWIRIKNDLIFKKNIATNKLDFIEEDYDWFELAKEVRLKKYPLEAKDFKEKTKQQNYLLRRGFSFEQIKYAFE